jgi:pimeloyl-ACP methyl ester carboxylesterase
VPEDGSADRNRRGRSRTASTSSSQSSATSPPVLRRSKVRSSSTRVGRAIPASASCATAAMISTHGAGGGSTSSAGIPAARTPAPPCTASRTARVSCGSGRAFRPLLSHISTADTARDLDVLRRVVGDRKLTYVGFSYGTAIVTRDRGARRRRIRSSSSAPDTTPTLRTPTRSVSRSAGTQCCSPTSGTGT